MHCAICLGTIEPLQSVTLGCTHVFHGQCITDWLWQKQSCPVCRNEPDNSESSGSDLEDQSFLEELHDANHVMASHARKRQLMNALRRKGLNANPEAKKLKDNIMMKKVAAKSLKAQLALLDRAQRAHTSEKRKEEYYVRNSFREQLNQVNQKFRSGGREIHVEALHLKSKLRYEERSLEKLENRLLSLHQK